MKVIILCLSLLATQAFAFDICKYEMTADFEDAFKTEGVKVLKVVSDFYALNSKEKSLIHRMVKNFEPKATLNEALDLYGDFWDGSTTPGSLSGDITYHSIKGKKIIAVRYYPGDNEYGAFYELKNQKYFQLAVINDSQIICK